MEEINKVLKVFEEMFGEERVELQYWDGDSQVEEGGENGDMYIMVFFPEVTITNENKESHLIKELWVRIGVNSRGFMEGQFSVTRTYLTYAEAYAGYYHSHAHIARDSDLTFSTVCLGRTPLKDLCTSLNDLSNLLLWRMFCYELNRFTCTESLDGIPFIRLSSVSPIGEPLYNICVEHRDVESLNFSLVPANPNNLKISKDFFFEVRDKLVMDDGVIRLPELYTNEGLRKLNLLMANRLLYLGDAQLLQFIMPASIDSHGILNLHRRFTPNEESSGSIYFKGKEYPRIVDCEHFSYTIHGVEPVYFYFIILIGLHTLNLALYDKRDIKVVIPHPHPE